MSSETAVVTAFAFGVQLRLAADLGCPSTPDSIWGEWKPDRIGVPLLANYLLVQWTRGGTERCSGLESFDVATGAFGGRVYNGHQLGDFGIMADGVTEIFKTYEIYHPSGLLALGYCAQPLGRLSWDGRYAIFATDWGSGTGNPPVDLGAGDSYLIDLRKSILRPFNTPAARNSLPTLLNGG